MATFVQTWVVVPSGAVTLLFTDIEGSTRAWEAFPVEMEAALGRHDVLVRAAVEGAGGYVFKTVGDAFCAAFGDAADAVRAAVEVQRALGSEVWPEATPIRVRMGLHSGVCVERGGDYFGPTVNRAARLEAIAHGGQVVVSKATADLVGGRWPAGAEPRDLGEHRLKDLGVPERVFQVDVADLGVEFPPLRSLSNPQLANNLPQYAASFVGREVEVAAVRELVEGARVVTLTGPGGAGKTRLAVQVAAELLDGSGDGVWIVDLAPVTDEATVPTTIADALGVRTGSIEGLVEAVADRRLLIVLDNCEHLIDQAAAAADRLVGSCPGVVLMVTSREPLGIGGEVIYRVPSLGLPDPLETDSETIARAECVRLFTDRVRLHDPDFDLDTGNAVAVGAVCRRLDGIPLAVELAAARLRSMSPDELLGRLDQRFRLLTGGSRTAMARQQTLRATIDWSFELLDEHERTVLIRASVFAGGWDLPAAEAVTADAVEVDPLDVLDALAGLADKSLLTVEPGDTTRYRMLETIREYSAEKLAAHGPDANTSVRQRHLTHYLTLAEDAAPRLRTADQRRWLDRLETDHDNLRAALVAATDLDQTSSGLRLGTALRWYSWQRARGHDLIEPLTTLTNHDDHSDPLLVADARVAAAAMAFDTDDYTRANTMLNAAIQTFRTLGDQIRLADAIWISGWVAGYAGDLDSAETLLHEGLTAAEAARDPDTTARMHGILGCVFGDRGDYGAARHHFGIALIGYLELGDRMQQTSCLGNMGDVELQAGNIDAADQHLQAAEAIGRDLDFREHICVVVLNRANVAGRRGDDGCALHRAVEALSLAHRHGLTRMVAHALVGCARPLVGTDSELAAKMHGAASGLLATSDLALQPLEIRLYDETEIRLRATLGDDTYEQHCTTGRGLAVHDLIAFARSNAQAMSST